MAPNNFDSWTTTTVAPVVANQLMADTSLTHHNTSRESTFKKAEKE